MRPATGFKSALVKTLAEAGKEVIAIDKNEEKVREVRAYTDYAFVVDNLSETALKETGMQNCGTVTICIGEKIDMSILTTMLVIKLGVPHVIAKATSEVHGEVLKRMDEPNSALTGQILWSGFKTGVVTYIRRERKIGKSRWTLKKKIRLVADTLFSFSTLPITIVTGLGFLSVVGSVIWAIDALVSKLTGHIDVTGWTMMFIFQLLSFGVVMTP